MKQINLDQMPQLFAALHKKMMDNHQKILLTYGLTKMHMPYLMILNQHPDGLTQRDMIDALFLDKGHASRALRDLIALEMIKKDDETMYKNKYYLCEKGKLVVLAMKKDSEQLRMKILESMTEEEVILFRNLSEKIIKILE